MQALILAGGQGTRLRPHTEALPKPLLSLGSSTILDRQIESLQKEGVSRITIITGFFSEKIHEHIRLHHPSAEVQFIHNAEFEHSRPAFAIIQALPFIQGDDCVYLNGDVLYDHGILHKIIGSSHESVTAIQDTPWDEEQVKVILDDSSTVRHISKNIPLEESHGEFIGVTKLSRELLTSLTTISINEGAETFRYAFAIDLLNYAINTHSICIHALDVSDLPAIEIDTPEDYARATELVDLFSAPGI